MGLGANAEVFDPTSDDRSTTSVLPFAISLGEFG